MKRYEKMSKEELVALLKVSCGSCIVAKIKGHGVCLSELSAVLNEEIKMIPRAWTFKTAEEVAKAWNARSCENIISCDKCNYYENDEVRDCYTNWLFELIEKPAEEKR